MCRAKWARYAIRTPVAAGKPCSGPPRPSSRPWMSSERAERTKAMTDKMKTDGGPTDPAVPETVSILPLRDLVVFPHAVVPLAAGRESSLRLIEDAVRAGRPIGTFGQLE